jgi:hypothetical protein
MFLRAERDYKAATSGNWTANSAEIAEIERRLTRSIPESFDDIQAIIDYALGRLQGYLGTERDSTGMSAFQMIRNARAGMLHVQAHQHVTLVMRNIEKTNEIKSMLPADL